MVDEGLGDAGGKPEKLGKRSKTQRNKLLDVVVE